MRVSACTCRNANHYFIYKTLSLAISHYARVSRSAIKTIPREKECAVAEIARTSHRFARHTPLPRQAVEKLRSHRPLTILESCPDDLFSSKVKSESVELSRARNAELESAMKEGRISDGATAEREREANGQIKPTVRHERRRIKRGRERERA